jgi:uncharacterized phage protein gp47/JayE
METMLQDGALLNSSNAELDMIHEHSFPEYTGHGASLSYWCSHRWQIRMWVSCEEGNRSTEKLAEVAVLSGFGNAARGMLRTPNYRKTQRGLCDKGVNTAI